MILEHPNKGLSCAGSRHVYGRQQASEINCLWYTELMATTKRTRPPERRVKEAVEQLNNWSKSGIALRFTIWCGLFTLWHKGSLLKLGEDDFLFRPETGGGNIEFHPSRCRTGVEVTQFSTAVNLYKGQISINLWEWFGDSEDAEEAFSQYRAHTKRLQ